MTLFVIARSTFNEAIRRRILMVLLFFALAMIGGAFVFSNFLPTTQEKMVTDMGLSAIQLFGVVISIAMAITMIPAEIDRRTIHTILSKPVSRRMYVLGKFLGGVATLGLMTVIMAVVFLAALYFKGDHSTGLIIEAVFLWFMEFTLLMGIAIFLSIVVSPMVNAFICICVLILGNLTAYIQYLKTFSTGSASMVAITKTVFQWIYNLVPNFQNYDISQKVAQGQTVPANYAWIMFVWTVFYVAFLLLMTMHFFGEKEV
ncbi:MAG TPA: ABC transporter permease subunit [Armatimonadota bacterium]|nr:ABC transporter permease subunit [Armatimonadota bacterium]